MRRFIAIAGATTLLAAAALPALAAPPSRDQIVVGSLSPTAATIDGCVSSGSTRVGQIQTNRRGKSGAKAGRAQYHLQLKLTDGSPSAKYNVTGGTLQFTAPVPPAVVGTCELVDTFTTQLKTNPNGIGVKNVKVNVTADRDLLILFDDTSVANVDLVGSVHLDFP